MSSWKTGKTVPIQNAMPNLSDRIESLSRRFVDEDWLMVANIELLESGFVTHIPCEVCGSKDNAAIYSDGHTYLLAAPVTLR